MYVHVLRLLDIKCFIKVPINTRTVGMSAYESLLVWLNQPKVKVMAFLLFILNFIYF